MNMLKGNSKKMKILEVVPNLQTGGAEKFVIDLTNEFNNKNYEVVLVTLYDKNDSDPFENLIPNIKRVSLHKKSGFDYKCIWNLYRLIMKEKPTVVHTHVEAIKYLLLAVHLYKRCDYYVTVHSDAKHDSGIGLNFKIRKYFYDHKLVTPITISPASAKSFEDVFGIKTTMIINGCVPYSSSDVDLNRYREGVDKLLVHAARIEPVKNQLMLVRVVDRLIKEGYKLRLLILGRPQYPDIVEEIEQYTSTYIQFLGVKSNVRDYMAVADGFCLSSLIEGMPITLIEAFSTGCIPIVTPAGGCIDMVKNKLNGFISDEISEESYYNALKEFCDTPKMNLNKIREESLNSYIKSFSISKTADLYLTEFQKNS